MSVITTSTKFIELKGIGKLSQNLAFGYVRQFENNHSLQCMETLIPWLCLDYCYSITIDYFYKYDDLSIKVSNRDCTITSIKNNDFKPDGDHLKDDLPIHFAMGKLWIPSLEKVKVVWRLKINKLTRGGCNVIIRIMTDENQYMIKDKKHVSYGFCNAGCIHGQAPCSAILGLPLYRGHEIGFSEGDTIKAILDLYDKSFELQRIQNDNDENTLIKWQGIEHSSRLKYKLMVQINAIGNSVSITKCTFETH